MNMHCAEQADSPRIGSDYAFFELFVVLVSLSLRLLDSGLWALLSVTNLPEQLLLQHSV